MIDFESIYNHIIPINDFGLKWRFLSSNTKMLTKHIDQLKPLDKKASGFLWDYIATIGLHDDAPFKKGFFRILDKIRIEEDNSSEIRKWLYHRGFPFSKNVFLSWQPDTAMIVSWKMLVKYFDDFYYGVSDDLTIIDDHMNWALLFHHEGQIFFGTNTDFLQDTRFDDIDII